MNETNSAVDGVKTRNPLPDDAVTRGPSRRKFLSQIGAALAGGAVLGKASIASAQANGSATEGGSGTLVNSPDPRVKQSYRLRKAAAAAESHIPGPPPTTNG